MCVIAFAPKGVDIPNEEQIRAMWTANPDGAGFAYVGRNGKVVYKKGFMTVESLLSELSAPEKYKNTNFAIHFRIGTSGKNDERTCHPFPVTTVYGKMIKTAGVEKSVLFHNGVLDDGGIINPLSSDTQDFVAAMAPLLEKYNESKARDHFIEELVVNNRLLIMYEKNKFKMFGKWQKDGDLWVSNTYYKSYSWGGADYTGYGHSNRWWEDWYENYQLEKTKALEENEDSAVEKTATEKQEEKDEATRLYERVLLHEYIFASPRELQIMKNHCDADEENVLYVGKYAFAYDETDGLVYIADAAMEKSPMEEE